MDLPPPPPPNAPGSFGFLSSADQSTASHQPRYALPPDHFSSLPPPLDDAAAGDGDGRVGGGGGPSNPFGFLQPQFATPTESSTSSSPSYAPFQPSFSGVEESAGAPQMNGVNGVSSPDTTAPPEPSNALASFFGKSSLGDDHSSGDQPEAPPEPSQFPEESQFDPIEQQEDHYGDPDPPPESFQAFPADEPFPIPPAQDYADPESFNPSGMGTDPSEFPSWSPSGDWQAESPDFPDPSQPFSGSNGVNRLPTGSSENDNDNEDEEDDDIKSLP